MSRPTWRRGARHAVLLACLLLPACTGGSEPLHAPGAPHVTSSPSPTRRAGKGFRQGFALWPQDTFEGVVAAPPAAWRSDPNAVADRFATSVLGWTGARIRTHRLEIKTAEVQAIDPRSGERLDVSLRAAPADVWSVLNVLPHGEYFPTVSVRNGRASVGVELGGDAVAAHVTVGYGARERSVTTRRDGTVHLDLGSRSDTPGHFLILFRNRQGSVVSAIGTTLPAGDFVAS